MTRRGAQSSWRTVLQKNRSTRTRYGVHDGGPRLLRITPRKRLRLWIRIRHAATAATPTAPAGLAVEPASNVCVRGAGNNRLRKIAAGGAVDTVAAALSAPTFAEGNRTQSAQW